MPNQELAQLDTSQLAAQAQAAYEEGRVRECLELLKKLAMVDPANVEAQALQSAIREDIQQDLHDARALLEHSGSPDEKKKYRKASEIILLKTLQLDSENEEAKILLQSTRALSGGQTPHHQNEEVPFVAAPVLSDGGKRGKKKSRLKGPIALLILAAIGGGYLLLQSRTANPATTSTPTERTAPASTPDFTPRPQQTGTPPVAPAASAFPTPTPSATTSTPAAAAPPVTPPVSAGTAATAAAAGTAPVDAAAAPILGKLAVSSPVTAEIYMNGRYLGSTPTTLQLPPGRQTLEYRRNDLRNVVNHQIRPNETTTASVTFQVNVQINAKPWAQVFLDGTARRPLGQTPLSGVTVPIGGVLVFENPNFPSKSYRITEKDAAIQVDFP
jgi:hypothetical protein